jgi:hypothetical protein
MHGGARAHVGIVRTKLQHDLKGLEQTFWHARPFEPHRHIAAEVGGSMNVKHVAHRLRQGEECAGCGEDRVHRIVGHAMIDDV